MMVSAKEVANEVIEKNQGWFGFSSEILHPLIADRNKIFSKSRSKSGCD